MGSTVPLSWQLTAPESGKAGRKTKKAHERAAHWSRLGPVRVFRFLHVLQGSRSHQPINRQISTSSRTSRCFCMTRGFELVCESWDQKLWAFLGVGTTYVQGNDDLLDLPKTEDLSSSGTKRHGHGSSPVRSRSDETGTDRCRCCRPAPAPGKTAGARSSRCGVWPMVTGHLLGPCSGWTRTGTQREGACFCGERRVPRC